MRDKDGGCCMSQGIELRMSSWTAIYASWGKNGTEAKQESLDFDGTI